MRVLIIQPWIRLGGAEMVSVNLAHHLSERGHDVALACTFLDLSGMPPPAAGLRYLTPGPRVARLLREHRLLFLLIGPWVLSWIVWRQSKHYDILNPHEFPCSWIAALVGSIRRIPVVWTSYGPTPRFKVRDALRLGIADWIGWMIASSWIDRVITRLVSAIYVPSERSRRQVFERYGRDAKVIHLGVDAAFYGKGNGERCLAKYGLAGKYVLLCVGKLHPQENQWICLEALSRILPHVPNVFLVLAGDGPTKVYWQTAATKLGLDRHTIFLGHVSGEEIRDLYEACTIHLFPPLNESWGLTPFEALSAGKVSIVSDECGASEVLEEHGIGVICSPTAGAFASQILELHGNPLPYRDMAQRGRTYVVDHLTWDSYTDQVVQLISELGRDDLASLSQLRGGKEMGG